MKPKVFHHSPQPQGWEFESDTEEATYWVWRPSDTRPWTACWQDFTDRHGCFADSADGPEDAMLKAGFPDDIFKLFLDTIKR